VPLLIVLAIVGVFAYWKSHSGADASAPLGGGGGGRPNPVPVGGPIYGGSGSAPSGNTDVLDNIGQEIATVEGFFIPGSRAQRLNNPGNVGGDSAGGYADAGDGWGALNNWITKTAAANPSWDYYDLIHYFQTGDTLGQGKPGFINPDTYAEQVAAAAGANPTDSVYNSLGLGG
jgi:hypothetical protein